MICSSIIPTFAVATSGQRRYAGPKAPHVRSSVSSRPRWLVSDECFGEFTAAWYAGQRIVPLLADATALDEKQTNRLSRVLGEDQGVDLSRALKDGRLDLEAVPEIAEPLKAGLRASGALAKIGIDPEAFEIDREIRPSPFPCLQSFTDTDADAAIF
jgi:hypothetical protein